MKESGPLGGHVPGMPLDLPMHVEFFTSDYLLIYDFLSAFKINITTLLFFWIVQSHRIIQTLCWLWTRSQLASNMYRILCWCIFWNFASTRKSEVEIWVNTEYEERALFSLTILPRDRWFEFDIWNINMETCHFTGFATPFKLDVKGLRR